MTLASLSRGNDIHDEMVNLQTIINKTSELNDQRRVNRIYVEYMQDENTGELGQISIDKINFAGDDWENFVNAFIQWLMNKQDLLEAEFTML